MGVCKRWTGLLDWTTGLDFDLANGLAIHHAAQYNNSLSRTRAYSALTPRTRTTRTWRFLGGKHVHAVQSKALDKEMPV